MQYLTYMLFQTTHQSVIKHLLHCGNVLRAQMFARNIFSREYLRRHSQSSDRMQRAVCSVPWIASVGLCYIKTNEAWNIAELFSKISVLDVWYVPNPFVNMTLNGG
jgi:hypothetical protein